MNLRAVIAIVAGSTFALVAGAAEKHIKKSEVPAAVLQSASAKYPKLEMTQFALEIENGKTVYEVQMQSGSTRTELSFTSDGRIISEEQTISMKDVPEVVRKAFALTKYGKAKVRRVEKVMETDKSDAPKYELLVEQSGKKHELVFAPDGQLTKEEHVGKED